MATVNFRCGNCQGLLAVGEQHLGQQVRCPHCQKVIVAPASAAPPPAIPASPPAPPAPPAPPPPLPATLHSPFIYVPPEQREEHESIFTAPTQTDDIFGQPEAPKFEMPMEPTYSPAPPPIPTLELTTGAEPAPVEATVSYLPEPTQANGLVGAEPADGRVAPPAAVLTEAPAEPPPMMNFRDEPGSTTGPRRPTHSFREVLFYSLISYSILATFLMLFMLWKLKDKPGPAEHPLKLLPDLEGDHPTKKDGKFVAPRPRTSMPLPADLRVGLKDTLRIGDLEVTPVEVAWAGIDVRGSRDGEASPLGKGLKLKLELKNLSSDLTFYPMDRYFTRYWIAGGRKSRDGLRRWSPPDREPYTCIEIDRTRYYGGPAGYAPPFEKDCENEFVVGQEKFDEPLKPGETLKTIVCSDPEDQELRKALRNADDGLITWRVQVRRGAVVVDGRRIPCSAVIGVEFKGKQIDGTPD